MEAPRSGAGLSVGERVAAASNRFYLRIRHRDGFTAAAEPGTVRGFDALRGHKYALFTSFKRSGEAVPTPVWFGVGEEGNTGPLDGCAGTRQSGK